MSTIPAKTLVNVLPNVLSAGGTGLVMNGILLTRSTRVPPDQVLSFANDGVSVAAYFGASSDEAALADIYFLGFDGSTKKPESILFAQFHGNNIGGYLRSGKVSTLTLSQLKALSGSLDVVVDGYTYSATSIDLSSATSYSSAAALIQTGLNTTLPTGATCTGAIAPGTASVTAYIAGNVMTVTAVGSGTLVVGAQLSGTGVAAGTQIDAQLSGATGGIGTYAVSVPQSTDTTTVSASYGTLTVSNVASGTLSVGQTISGSGVTADTMITALGTGTGLTGTYIVDTNQTASSTTITTTGTALVVSYDSVTGTFVIASGTRGVASTVAFATGTLAAGIYLTQATGAILSQGADAATPGVLMDAIVQATQNWGTFMTIFDPDAGNGSDSKQAFAVWTNAQNSRYAYIAWDADITPTESSSATSSFGYIVTTAEYSGTCPIYDPTNGASIAAFICGTAASINFDATEGRITFAFRGQSGLTPGVTDATVASNLQANGYNFYGAYATANQQFLLFQPGSVSGKFLWLDSYINQIWLNNALQLAGMTLMSNINSLPYNTAGYSLVAAAFADPIQAGLNFGAIRTGVNLSNQQRALINNAAGNTTAANTVILQGWYLQVKDAASTTRQARQSPPMNFWYADGESIQKIELNSVVVQ